MKDYTDFLNAPDEPQVKDFSDFLNAPDEPRRVETKGSTFKQYDPSGSLISRLFGKYAPDVLDVIGGAVNTMKGAVNTVSPGSVTNTGIASELGLPYDADPSSNAYLAGQIVDPAALVLGGLVGKGVQALPAVSKGYKAARAVTAGKNVPMTAEGVLRLGASGAGVGAGTAYLASEGDLTAAGEGGVAGGVIGTALPITGKAVQLGLGKATDVIKGTASKVKAGQIARAAAGDNLPAIRAAMQNAAPDLTAGQAAYGINQDPWQALGALAENKDTASFYRTLMERQAQNRAGMLTGVTPDLAAAESARKASKNALYPRAFAADEYRQSAATVGPVRPEFVVTNPSTGGGYYKPVTSLKPSLPAAIRGIADEPIMLAAAKDAGDSIRIDPDIPAAMRAQVAQNPMQSVRGLHNMKAAIDEQLRNPNPNSALAAYKSSSLQTIKRQLVEALKQTSKEYDAARVDFATKSQPINQANVLEQVRRKLVNPLAEGKERAGVFAAGLDRGEESVLKAAGLNTRFNDSIEAALTPEQFKTVNQIRDELVRNQAIKGQAQQGAGGLGIIVRGESDKFRLPNLFNQKVALANKFLEVAEDYLKESSIKAISEGMRSGKTALEMLDTLPAAERNKAMMWIGQAGQLAPAAAGVTGATMSNKP